MKTLSLIFFLFVNVIAYAVETSFVALDAKTGSVLRSIGCSLDTRVSPCSTFKIPLSLMGFDSAILQDEDHPVWEYPGVDVPVASHKIEQSPKTWMDFSVVWYSKRLIQKLGKDSLQRYVSLFSYGNENVSGQPEDPNSFVSCHLGSSLKISPREQVCFLKKFLYGQLPVSQQALCMAERIIPHNVFKTGVQIFGKTGSGFEEDKKIAWYVGWINLRNEERIVFALLLQDVDFFPTQEERRELVLQFLNMS